MLERDADERAINDRDQAHADRLFDGLSDAGRIAFNMFLRARRALNYTGTIRLALLRQWMRQQGLPEPQFEVTA